MKSGPKYQQWVKDNYRNQVGLRPIKDVLVQNEANQTFTVSPDDFLFRKRGEKVYIVLNRHIGRVHFPRSLGRRVRVTLDKTDTIKGETNKCFSKK